MNAKKYIIQGPTLNWGLGDTPDDAWLDAAINQDTQGLLDHACGEYRCWEVPAEGVTTRDISASAEILDLITNKGKLVGPAKQWMPGEGFYRLHAQN